MNKKYESFLDLVIYQIYPRSFNDSNNDGIGDINGVIEKLDYLRDLGVNAIWMCPCYKSPNYDNGYDIADYYDIMDEFGTMDDMKRLIAEMDKRGMKLIMDFVGNHTSSENKWFIESQKSKDNPYSDYYYWCDEPLNDWKGYFDGKSAWEYVESRNQYYLHSYTKQQPDLNWDNPQVVKEMQNVIDFWSNLGVIGFRCDVIEMISKDFEHNRNGFGPNLHKYINALFGRKESQHLFAVGECWGAKTIEDICKYTNEDRGELSTLFQFDHHMCGQSNKWTANGDTLKDMRDILIKWQNLTQDNDILYSIFTDNHDNNFLLSRVGNDKELRYESATCIATMIYLLKGVCFIYQGQEFGQAGAEYDDISYFDDPESIGAYQKFMAEGMSKEEAMAKINFCSRDNPRHPMAWDNSENAGFSEAKPWLAVHSRAKEINLENDLNSEKSVFRFYKDMLRLRKENDAFRKGKFSVVSKPEDPYFIYIREYDDGKFTVICNFEESSKIDCEGMNGELVLSNYKDSDIKNNNFKPYEIAVFKNR